MPTSRARNGPSVRSIDMDRDARRRTRMAVLAAISIGGIGVSAPVAREAFGATALGPSPSADVLLKSAISAATRAGSVRVTVHFFSGKTTGVLVQDSSQDSGEQTVAIGKERGSVVLRNGTVYFSGNRSGLVNYFGMTEAVASTLSNRWVSATSADSSYAALTAGLTLSSALKEVSPTAHIVTGRTRTIHGDATTSVSGTVPAGLAQVSLFIAKKGRPLPVEAVGSEGTKTGSSSGEIVAFSRWGETVHVPQPTDSVPISVLAAGSATSSPEATAP
jgi:hypothetical protein